MSSLRNLNNPVTLVTGASSGIGEEIAREAARRGHRLVLTARRTDRIAALAAELGALAAIPGDLSAPGGVAGLVEELSRRDIAVDILVNNAGVGRQGSVATLPAALQTGQIDLNVRALTELTIALLPAMVARGAGGILNVASLAAFQAGPNLAVYFATKAYVLSFSEALHEEAKAAGVNVTALCPGPTRSEFADVAHLHMSTALRSSALVADPAEVARTGLDALERNRAIAVPGLANRIAAFGTRLVPRSVARRIAGRIQK
ncbi:SDR family NAD(P)-dependent oxidoreductase [Novosphingobium sp. BL-52-GroH]|uniref:SDR family NAD(P)-dependent oxidoreductase n=1 Tax=Novosphingobium sp. BL-52-GroH TaxID=3349877 RepID=UPI00384B6E87